MSKLRAKDVFQTSGQSNQKDGAAFSEMGEDSMMGRSGEDSQLRMGRLSLRFLSNIQVEVLRNQKALSD